MDFRISSETSKVVIGLGNPGKRYAATRHNLGFQVIDRAAFLKKKEFVELGSKISFCRLSSDDVDHYLAKPLTYMNQSGAAVKALVNGFGVKTENLLVVCDDCNLPPGKIRFRKSGTDGGHRGLGSIIEAIGSIHFPRLRLGIGPSPENVPLEDFVLQEFSQDELKLIDLVIDRSIQIMDRWLAGDLNAVSATFNVTLT